MDILTEFFSGNYALVMPNESKLTIEKLKNDYYLCEYREVINASPEIITDSFNKMSKAFEKSKTVSVVKYGNTIGYDMVTKDVTAFLYSIISEYIAQILGRLGNNSDTRHEIRTFFEDILHQYSKADFIMDDSPLLKEILKNGKQKEQS